MRENFIKKINIVLFKAVKIGIVLELQLTHTFASTTSGYPSQKKKIDIILFIFITNGNQQSLRLSKKNRSLSMKNKSRL